jgi:chromosome segregation ATPase
MAEPCLHEREINNIAGKITTIESRLGLLETAIAVIGTRLENILQSQATTLNTLTTLQSNYHDDELAIQNHLTTLSAAISNNTAVTQRQYSDMTAFITQVNALNTELTEQDKMVSSVEKDLEMLSYKFLDRTKVCDVQIFGNLIDKVKKLEKLEKVTSVVCTAIGVLLSLITFIKTAPILLDILIKVFNIK